MAHRPQPDGPLVDYSMIKDNSRYKSLPRWYDCSADEFIRKWLPKFEKGTKPRPTQAELDALDLAGEEYR